MTFQFFGKRRGLHPAAVPDSIDKTQMPGTERETDARQASEPKRFDGSALMRVGPAQPTAIYCVELACAAFHAAQNSIVALTEGRDEMDAGGLPELCTQRDAAFQQVRSQPARTTSAYQAKVRVLLVMRDWFSVEDPEVSAFGIELAVEAAALLDKDNGQSPACQMMQGAISGLQLRGAKRRKPFAWFARSWSHASDTPFAR